MDCKSRKASLKIYLPTTRYKFSRIHPYHELFFVAFVENFFLRDVVLATLMDTTRETWQEAQVMYTYPKEHTIIMEAIPMAETTQVRRYRGYIAIDEIKFRGGHECKGHCTFDSGFCKFANDPSANFAWEVSPY